MSEVNNQIQVIERTCLQWEDYQNQFSGVVRQLLEENCMVDVTLSVSGQRILAHRIVLCAFSTFFKVKILLFCFSKEKFFINTRKLVLFYFDKFYTKF